jgi:hypothetical protein
MAELGLRAVIAHLPNSARSTVVFEDGNNEVQHPSRVASFRVLCNCGLIVAVCRDKITCPRRRDLFR